jgi:SAM-dependent methyltransferase
MAHGEMNLGHRLCCSSNFWANAVEQKSLPWVLGDLELGGQTLEIGPGYGANLRALASRTALTAVEVDGPLTGRLVQKYGDRARILNGDGTELQLPDEEFNSVVCFTMLHHVPTPALQDRMFAEAFRVLQPGGAFAGSDGVPSLALRIMHFRDTYNPVDPETLPERLRGAGFTDIEVDVKAGEQRWRAVKPS